MSYTVIKEVGSAPMSKDGKWTAKVTIKEHPNGSTGVDLSLCVKEDDGVSHHTRKGFFIPAKSLSRFLDVLAKAEKWFEEATIIESYDRED